MLVLDRITIPIKLPFLTPDLPTSEQFALCPGVFCVQHCFEVVTVSHNFVPVFYPYSIGKIREKLCLGIVVGFSGPHACQNCKITTKIQSSSVEVHPPPFEFSVFSVLYIPVLTSYTEY